MANSLDFLREFRLSNNNSDGVKNSNSGVKSVGQSFKDNLDASTKSVKSRIESDADKSQKTITARSGNNVRFDKSNSDSNLIKYLSDNFSNVLNDAIKYYKKEFNVTPRATIGADRSTFDDYTSGGASELADKTGQYNVQLKHVTEGEEPVAMAESYNAEKSGWWPKGSGGKISSVPTHELGHVLTFQLFPDYESVAKLYEDSMKDVGVKDPYSSKGVVQASKKAKEISGYAASGYAETPYAPTMDEYETIAEALTDYYYNRDKASDLSKAVVKRMKKNGFMYGITQSGGLAKRSSYKDGNETFLQNLRRYSAIQ